MNLFRHKPVNEAQGGGWDWLAIIIATILATAALAWAAHRYGWFA